LNRNERPAVFSSALALDGTSIDAMAALGVTFVRNISTFWSTDPIADEQRAEDLLRRTLRTAPDHFEANFGMGMLLRWQGRLVEAIELIELATEIDGTHSCALCHLGVANLYAGNPKVAPTFRTQQPLAVMMQLALRTGL
jgi:cytochrome c-type biogenesis protein CcmH/NrfG